MPQTTLTTKAKTTTTTRTTITKKQLGYVKRGVIF